MSNRVRWVDFGKGFTIFLVVIGHVALGTLESKNYSGINIIILRYLLETVYAVHIPVFFALSGYFFKPMNKIRDIYLREKKRFVSLFLPYVVFSIVMVFLKELGGSSVRNQNGLIGLINIYWQPIDYLWFLYALFVVDVTISILTYFINNKYFIMSLLILLFIIGTMNDVNIPIISYICLWAPFFYLGFLLNGIKITRKVALCSFLIYLLHIPLFCTLYPHEEYLFGYWRIVSIFAVFMMFYFFQNHKFTTDYKFFENCGKDSLIIYLVHAPVVSITRILLFKFGIDSLILQILGQFLMSCIGSIIVMVLANRVKIVDFIFKPTKYLSWF